MNSRSTIFAVVGRFGAVSGTAVAPASSISSTAALNASTALPPVGTITPIRLPSSAVLLSAAV